MSLQKYRSHKIVEAGVIETIRKRADGGADLTLSNGESFYVSPEYLQRNAPRTHGYYVRYADGYESYSPALAFESGYVPVADIGDTALSPEHIHAACDKFEFYRVPGTTLTMCFITLKNGFVVTGQDACADPAIFDEKKGQIYAQENALSKVWELEGYLLRQRLFEAGK